MPAYNAERFISLAIESILRQDFNGSYELLIADDVSNDGTASIIKKYQGLYPNIIKPTFRSENLGCSGNSLALAMSANGRYIAFCDSDDVWNDIHKLQIQYDFLEEHKDYGMVCTHAHIIDDEGKIINESGSIYTNGENAESIDLNKIAVMKSHCDVFNSSVMMRSDLYLQMKERCGWYIENNCFIDSVWAYYFTFYSKVRLFLRPLVLYRALESSDSHSDNFDKRYNLSKRSTIIRARFLLTNEYSFDERMDIISSEFDYGFYKGVLEGNRRTRNTKTYKFGEFFLSPLKVLRTLFN